MCGRAPPCRVFDKVSVPGYAGRIVACRRPPDDSAPFSSGLEVLSPEFFVLHARHEGFDAGWARSPCYSKGSFMSGRWVAG